MKPTGEQQRQREADARARALTEDIARLKAERDADADCFANRLRDLSLSLADAEARERRRLSRRLHDSFQQLLSAARLKAALIRRKVSDDSAQEIMQIERMLEEAIDESRQIATELSPPILHDAGLGAAIETFARSFERDHDLQITVDRDPAADPQAEQLRVLLFEAVRELLFNIAQHAAAKHVHIATKLLPHQTVEISLKDDGSGFDPTAPSAKQQKDAPMGLAELKERFRYIGGEMTIRSARGAGTEIILRAPLNLEANPASGRPGAAISADEKSGSVPVHHGRDKSTSTGKSPDLCRIVVADDHALFREGLINLLAHEPGFQVIGEAADGHQAISLVRSLQPELLIVDVTMPTMSGIEVASTLSHEMPLLKIVGLSMHDCQDTAQAMRQAGAFAYITKGGSSELLLSVLRSAINPTAQHA